MSDKEQSLDEWLAAERERLDEGFAFEPQPSSAPSGPGAAGQTLAGLGLGAGVVAGAVAPHPNPVTFEGCKANVIATALRSDVADDDTRVQVERTGSSLVVTILQSQKTNAHRFIPALSVTLIEKADTLTVTVSNLNQGSVRGAVGSIGGTLLEQGRQTLTRRRGVGGLLDMAGHVMEGVQDLVEDVQDLTLPRRVWAVIDRVGEATEQAFLDERRQVEDLQRKREATIRAWTHCEWCGRAYREDEQSRADCPSCGGPRGSKPDLLE